MKLAEIFTDSLVLQANKPIRVFGEAKGTVKVKIAFGSSIKSSTFTEAKKGRFIAELPSLPYGGPYTLTVTDNEESTVLSDVYIGEVILFSGQSNVQFHMAEEVTPRSEYRDDPNLRIFVSERLEEGEQLHPGDGWTRASVDNIEYWSALAYHTGKRARAEGIPTVGVVACSQGASIIQSWIDDSIYLGSVLHLPDELMHRDSHDEFYTRWNAPGMLYHAMIEPLIPFVFGNVLWYQGESNTSIHEGLIYVRLLDMMIRNWRGVFMNNMPFTVVQISDCMETEEWKLMQRVQLDAEKELIGVSTVICADICEKDEIHPPTKYKLADRIFESMRKNGTI